MADETICADTDTMARFIYEITRDWYNDPDQNGMFEIRCLGQDRHPVIQRFALHGSDEAVDLAVRMNHKRLNIYMTINPISNNAVAKAATDADIIRAHYSFADADDPAGLNGLTKLLDIIQPHITVTTGTTPHERCHAYWRVPEPCFDLSLWQKKQKQIAEHCKTDRSVQNPSRIMRVAGTVSYPDAGKAAKGYVSELVTMKIRAD
jgi:hypothetical protein